MSPDGLDVLLRGYAALTPRDEPVVLACLAQDVELTTVAQGTFRGHDGIRTWLAEMDEVWSSWRVTIEEARRVGERVLLVATLSARSRLHSIDTAQQFWIVWELRDGKGFRGVHFVDELSAELAAKTT